MSSDTVSIDRTRIVDRIRRVTDPELDRSIVELDYLDEIRPGSETTVRFSLPTAWCSPAFAWMMATDIRDEVAAIPGVDRVLVELTDHMHAREISEGVTRGLPFQSVFPDATEGVDVVREQLDAKARLARQYRAIETLLEHGLTPDQICQLTRADLHFDPIESSVRIPLDGIDVFVPATPLRRYVEKAREMDHVSKPTSPLFSTHTGEPLTVDTFEAVQHRGRAAAVNMTGQAGICAALHEARFGRSSDASADT